MTDPIDDLRARAAKLNPEELDEAVTVNDSILRLQAGDLLATRRLALTLIKLGELDRAEEIVQEAIAQHPSDNILLARAADIANHRRWAAKESAAKGKKRPAVAQVASTWIKAVHDDGSGWAEGPGDEMWLSDPGQRDAEGNRLFTAAGEPWGRPSWRIGEQAGVYFGGTQRVPVLVEDHHFARVRSGVRASGRLGE